MSTERYGSPWLTVKEAAAYCRCGERRIAAAVQMGEVPTYRTPGSAGRKIVHKDDLDSWIRTMAYTTPLAEALARAAG